MVATYIVSGSLGEVLELGEAYLHCRGQSVWWLPTLFRAVCIVAAHIVPGRLGEVPELGEAYLHCIGQSAWWLHTLHRTVRVKSLS